MKTSVNEIDLVIANSVIKSQNIKLEQYCAQLIMVRKKLETQYKKKQSYERKLVRANDRLYYENCEKIKRNDELVIANENLSSENFEKAKRSFELATANRNLTKAKRAQQEHANALEQMMFIISHKIRSSVASILGISHWLQYEENHSVENLKKYSQNIIQSAKYLNLSTHELSEFIHISRHNNDN